MALLPPDPVYTLRSPDIGAIHSICFHQDERLFAATKKGQVYLFDLQTNRSTYHFTIGENPINSIHHTVECLVTMEKGGGTKVRQLTNSGYKIIAEADMEHSGFCRGDIAHEPGLLFAARNDNAISVMKLETLEEVEQLVDTERTDLGTLSSLKYLQINGQDCLLAGYESGSLLLWDLREPTKPLSADKIGEFVTCIDYDLITNRGLAGNASDRINVFSINRANSTLQVRDDLIIKNAGLHCVRIRKDRKVFCTGGWDGRIRIFSWKSLRPLAVLTEHKAEVMDIAHSQGKVSFWKSNIMAAAGGDGQITLWDIYN